MKRINYVKSHFNYILITIILIYRILLNCFVSFSVMENTSNIPPYILYKSIVAIVWDSSYSYRFSIKKNRLPKNKTPRRNIYLTGKPIRVLIMKQNRGILFANEVFKTKFICVLIRAQRIIKFIMVPE